MVNSADLSAKSGYFSTLYEDTAMNSKIVIAVAVQFMLACAPLVGQAAALDRDKDPDLQWNIDMDRELFQDCLKQRDSLRVKGNRMALPQDRIRIHAKL